MTNILRLQMLLPEAETLEARVLMSTASGICPLDAACGGNGSPFQIE
jgi:hypothetical protein